MSGHERLSAKVIFGTFFSAIACILVYCVVLPLSLSFDAAERTGFWIRMGTVGIAAAALSTLIVFRLYRPIAKALSAAGRNRAACADGPEGGEGDCDAALAALDRIPNFLLWFGAGAYLAAACVNLGLDLARNGRLDAGLALARLFLAGAWGFLNGIVTARLLNMILIQAKLGLGIYDVEAVAKARRGRLGTMRGKLMSSGLALFLFLVVYAGVVFYVRERATAESAVAAAAAILEGGADASGREAALRDLSRRLVAEAVPGGLTVLGALLLIASGLYFVVLAELQAHFDDLLRQVKRIAEGDRDLSRRVNVVSFDDIGRMTSGFNRILDGLAGTFTGVRRLTESVYSGSADIRVETAGARERAAGLARLAEENDAAERERVAELGSAVGAFRAAAEGIGGSAEKSAAEAREIDRVSEAMRGMAGSFAASGEEAARAEAAFRELSASAEAGAAGVMRSLEAASAIAESGDKVGDIARIIGEVADRSNLLAMNASIEAAHAGESGKGFGVVAREIKKLAESVARSARDIGEEVKAVKEKNRRAVEAVEGLDAVFGELSSGIERTGAALKAIALSARRNSDEARDDLALIERLRGFTADIEAQAQSARLSVRAMEEAVDRLGASQARSGEVNAALGEGVRAIVASFDSLDRSLRGTLDGVQALENEVSSYRVG